MTKFAFDLDGTVTKEETLPLLAKGLGLTDEMKLLTKLTMEGKLQFNQSFKLRYHVLRNLPLRDIHEVIKNVPLDDDISNFIRENQQRCAIVTGNLDVWIKPLIDDLGCACYSSTSICHGGDYVLDTIIDKSDAIRSMRTTSNKVIAVGESFNDIPMFEEADVAIAYGGVHAPVDIAISVSDYVVFDGGALCQLLRTL